MNWKSASLFANVVLIAALVCAGFYIHNIKKDRDRYKTERNDARQQVTDLEAETLEVYEVADAYEKEIASYRADSSSLLRRLRNCAKVEVTNGPSTGIGDAAAGGSALSGVARIEAGELVEKFTACDINTARLIAAQNYIRTVCMANE